MAQGAVHMKHGRAKQERKRIREGRIREGGVSGKGMLIGTLCLCSFELCAYVNWNPWELYAYVVQYDITMVYLEEKLFTSIS